MIYKRPWYGAPTKSPPNSGPDAEPNMRPNVGSYGDIEWGRNMRPNVDPMWAIRTP